ncbi:MAG TPA: alpha/beta fold hydrolase [Thermoanaerobaculia bacterium]|nr:alpha/beta fold hydrolase [Thermoanaerobaculia bacterium]
MRSLGDLLLSSTALGPPRESAAAFREAVREAAGPHGVVEDLEHDGCAKDPACLHAVFASPGDPARRATLLFLHGKGGRGAEWRPDAVRALRLGYNVLVPDLRGHSPSGGKRITYGFFEREDLELLVAEATSRFGVDPGRLGVDACSMGTLVALQFAAEIRSPRALWLQSPFGDLASMAIQYVHRATGLPRAVVTLPTRLAVYLLERETSLPLASLDPVAAAGRVTCPTVVVHGDADLLVPIRFAPAVYEALKGPKSFWRAPRCGHCHHPDEPQAIRSKEYVARWTAFFSEHNPPAASRSHRPST